MPDEELNRLIHPEHAKLIPVSGSNDQPEMDQAVEVQFNPSTLKVGLSNTLKENPRGGNSRSAQFVDKSSSNLTVELIFDTTHIDSQAEQIYQERAQSEGRDSEAVTAGSDVRLLTKRIAEKFCKPVGTGQQMRAPKRCLFQWGAFEFLGMVQTFNETLDFFSPEGRPLRSTVSLKLSEDRYQFRNREVDQAARETPTLTSTGNSSAEEPSQDTPPLQNSMAGRQNDWRETAMYNGIESPRLPTASALAMPSVSMGVSLGASAGIGVKASFSASVSATAGVGASLGTSVKTQATTPAFRFGASAKLGTGIEGAFSTNQSGAGCGAGLSAGALISGGTQLRAGGSVAAGTGVKAGLNASKAARTKTGGGVGFD